jgi:hypothetical protein
MRTICQRYPVRQRRSKSALWNEPAGASEDGREVRTRGRARNEAVFVFVSGWISGPTARQWDGSAAASNRTLAGCGDQRVDGPRRDGGLWQVVRLSESDGLRRDG